MVGKHIAFVAVKDRSRARAFYEEVLGLSFIKDDGFALVYDLDGTMLRMAVVPDFAPQRFTVLGWEVGDIREAVTGLGASGVQFERYGFPGQDESGVWSAPDGSQVAWFKDPDGNVLSVSQHASIGSGTSKPLDLTSGR
jgi:catechol 2,3-dioxygenase-like lactoylglutathione lyase family enzyme